MERLESKIDSSRESLSDIKATLSRHEALLEAIESSRANALREIQALQDEIPIIKVSLAELRTRASIMGTIAGILAGSVASYLISALGN